MGEKLMVTLLQVIMAAIVCCLPVFAGIAYSAASPTISKLIFKDTKGTVDPSDDTPIAISAGYKAHRVAVDGNGGLYVTDPDTNKVYKYNSNGRLTGTYSIHIPLGITMGSGGEIYVGGSLNGHNTIFVLDQSGVVKGYIGDGTQNWKMIADLAVSGSGDVLAIEDSGNIVNIFKEGILSKTFGPYIERFNGPESINGTSYSRTRHSLTSASGMTFDNSSGEIYVTFLEYVDYLRNKACSSSSNCYEDPDSYLYYANTDSSYKYWYPAGARFMVAVIDRNGGGIKRKIYLDTYTNNSSTTINPKGLALDNSGRLYVASVQGIKVYDSQTGNSLTVNGGFDGGAFIDLAFDSVNGVLFATTENHANAYGIDGGISPGNTPPASPILGSPADGAYAASTTPTLEITNASDNEGDPLTYGYEIKDGTGAVLTGAAGIAEGQNGKTAITVNYTLSENIKYSWRAQSFDGNAASAWSEKTEFCVNEKNDNPEIPMIISPINSAPVSPFGSSLTWNSSKDPDCYDTVSYTFEISNDQGYSTALTSNNTANTSVKLSDIKGLTNGGSYYWRVKAMDYDGKGKAVGGESAYSTGSFVYKTTVTKFESDLPDTKVYIDGNYGYIGRLLGNSPLTVEGVTPGLHFVAFLKTGYETVYKIVNVADPLVNDSALTVTAKGEEWGKASKIRPAASSAELFKTSGNSTPFVVDYNNDGLKDVIAGDTDGNLYLYLSEDQLQEDSSKKVVLVAKGPLPNITVASRAVPFVVDFDNDGKKDLLVGSGDGHIYLYLNTGDDSAPLFTSAGTIKATGSDINVSNSAPSVVDYNNDGKKDLVVGSSEGTLRLYLNIGIDASPEFDAPVTIKADNSDLNVGLNSNSKVFFTDWNSDGKKDMVVGGSTVNLFFNVGTDETPVFVSIQGLQQWIKEKKRVRGNREFIPYLGYSQDLEDMTNGNGEAAPFVVDWDGTPARDVVVGNGAGGVSVNVTVTGE